MSAGRDGPLVQARPRAAAPSLADDVRQGLGGTGQKTLPSRLLYDDLGSALYESITFLPEYGLTRADERILERHSAEIMSRLGVPLAVAELGSGTGRKTRRLLEALDGRAETDYFPIDLSPTALARCRLEIGELPRVRVTPIEAEYLEGLRRVKARRGKDGRLLVLFLGSTIGNFDRPVAEAFVRDLRRVLRPGDAFLLGTDLLKPVPALLAAYDDALGVTAAFDLNLLVRINRELGADFDPRRFEHQARWNDAERRVEMHLVARGDHTVRMRVIGLEVGFRAGESIWTESSHKYRPEEPIHMAEAAGFELAGQWLDKAWPFAETLFVAR